MRIGKDSWNIIQRVIRRYPESKRKYQDALDAAMYPGASESKGDPYEVDPDYTKPVSITEAAALRLNSPYVQRLKKEVEAVETAFNNLDSEEQSLIRARYWNERWKNKAFLKIDEVYMSEMTMRRICRRFIVSVGMNIGEVENE